MFSERENPEYELSFLSMLDSSMNVPEELNASVLSVESEFTVTTSTPRKKKKTQSPKKKIFKTPQAKLVKDGGECPRCKKIYLTKKSLKEHTDEHIYTDLAARRPSLNNLEEFCLGSSCDIVKEIYKCPLAGDLGNALQDYLPLVQEKCGSAEWKVFLKSFLSNVKQVLEPSVVLPIQIRRNLLKGTAALFSSDSIVEDLIDKVIGTVPCDRAVANAFLVHFSAVLNEFILKFLFEGMRRDAGSVAVTSSTYAVDNFDTTYSKQNIHRIAGSIMRRFLRTALKPNANEKWKRLKSVITMRFLKSGVSVVSANETEAWTAALDRGKLLYVDDKVVPFLVELSKILASLELPNGSILHKTVCVAVFKSTILLQMWSDLIEDSLSTKESLNFFYNFVTSFTNTFGVGVVRRRQNQVTETVAASLGLRAQLAASSHLP